MQVKITSESAAYEALLKEGQDILAAGSDTASYALRAVPDRACGYAYEKKDGVLTVHFAFKSDLCRALLAASAGQEQGEAGGAPAKAAAEAQGRGVSVSAAGVQAHGVSDFAAGAEERHFAELGYMADCSRNAAANVPTLKKLIRTLAFMGYQFLGLYIEDMIHVEGEPYFGYMRGAYSKAEIREVSEYAAIFGMEVRPYVQTLAHLNQITRYAQYQKFIDCDDILLADEPRTYEFLDRYLGAAADAFTTKKINIGMDEAHMVGLGKYLDRHGFTDRVDIILRHLDRVMAICRKYGLQPQMWSDMFFRLAFGGEYYVSDKALAANVKIPEGLELTYWDYYHTDEAHYDRMLRSHRALTPHVAFAGGAWKWTGFAPHNYYSMEASRAALTSCKRNGVQSVVITGWGDNGAEASQFSTLPALFEDANLAYDGALGDKAFRALTGMEREDFLLVEASNPYGKEYPQAHTNAGKFLLYNDPLIGTFDSVAARIEAELPDYYTQAAERLEEAAVRSEGSSFAYLLRTQAALCQVLRRKATLGLRLRAAYESGDRETLRRIAEAELPELAISLDAFFHIFREQWMKENKAFGFEVQAVRIGGLRLRLLEAGERVREYLAGTIPAVDELAQPYLPFAYQEDDTPQSLTYNGWHETASPAVMG